MKTLREAIRLILEADAACPVATQDIKVNTKNRDAAIKADHIHYGPMNLSDEEYWEHLAEHWNTSAEVAKQSKCKNCAAFDVSPRMKQCMPGEVDQFGELGYCWMHHFKCHSERTCYTWAAGGPITDDAVSQSWQSKDVSETANKRRLSILRND